MLRDTEVTHERPDWIDGFVFVGNQLALDFLNTKLVVEGEEVEMLPDRQAFERWCVAAGIGEGMRAGAGGDSVAEVREFREQLRSAVMSLEKSVALKPEFLDVVNSLLSRHPARMVVSAGHGGLAKKATFAMEEDGFFWGAIAKAIAELLTEMEHHRVRKCEHCVIHFYDVSKKGSRRWCSMGLCGNRVKVAAYQKRRRAEG
jgi:predicted RNA-binding Zn ribbon-like protein